MLNIHRHRCLRRTRPTAPTSFRRAVRPRLEALEAREVPATTMIRTPYSPYGQPAVVASLPQRPEPQQLTYSIDNNAAGNSVTVSAHIPVAGDPLPDAGVYVTLADHLGNPSASVRVAEFDFDATDHYTKGITGDVDVSNRRDGGYAITYVEATAHYPDPMGFPDWLRQDMVVRIFDANGTELAGPGIFDSIVDNEPLDNIHYGIVKPKVGMDNLWGVTGAWQVVTNVDPADPEPGSTTVSLYETRWRYDEITGLRYFTPTQLVAQSFLDRGNGSFSEYAGDFILSHDLATNASGKNVVVYDHLIVPEQPNSSAYMTLEAIHRKLINADGTIVIDVDPDNEIVSQNADTYEPTATPHVTMNDLVQAQFGVVWTYAPPYSIPEAQLPAGRGVYTRFGDWNGWITNEIRVVASPNSDGRHWYPTPPQFYVGHLNEPIAMNNAGNVLVGYFDSAQTSVTPHRLRGQLFNIDGTPIGDRFSLFEADSPYAQGGVGPEQFAIDMDENSHVTAAIGNPNPVAGTWVSVVLQRFVRVEFDVQRGEIQRDHVQYVDFTFNPGMVDVPSLLNPGRVQLLRSPLYGPQQFTPVPLDGVLSYAGNVLTMNFGLPGLEDGYYKVLLDLDGDGIFEMVRSFYRKFGDFSGTGLNQNPFIWFLLND
jgi:hypothetical protein